jgi:hypothetical protein
MGCSVQVLRTSRSVGLNAVYKASVSSKATLADETSSEARRWIKQRLVAVDRIELSTYGL